MKRHKGIKGQSPMRFDSLSHEALLQRHERAAFSNKQEPWTVRTPQRVATSIERLRGTLGYDTISFHGLSVRPRTHDDNSENPVKRAERRPEGRYRTYTPCRRGALVETSCAMRYSAAMFLVM